jgi:hypothetical protein
MKMRTYIFLLLSLLFLGCNSEPHLEAEIPKDIRIAAENSFFYLAEEMKSVYLEYHPDTSFQIFYGTPKEIQELFIQDKASVLITSSPLFSATTTHLDTSGIVVVDEIIGRESLWYFGPYTQSDSIICAFDIEKQLKRTLQRKAAFLFSGYIEQPFGLFESMVGEPVPTNEFIPLAFPAFDHLDSLFRQFPDAWGVVGSSQWLLSASSEKNNFARCCRWKRIRPCNESSVADKLRFREVHLLGRSEAGNDFVHFWKGAVGQVRLRRSGIKIISVN